MRRSTAACCIFFFAADALVPPATDGAIRLVLTDGGNKAQLQTAVFRYTEQKPDSVSDGTVVKPFTVDLIGTLHLADRGYFYRIQRESQKYDRFLYELITSRASVVEDETGIRRVRTSMDPTAEQVALARTYGLQAQISCIDFLRYPSWSLADLSKEDIQALRSAKGKPVYGGSSQIGVHLIEVFQAFAVGRSAKGKVLPKFFFGSGLNSPALLVRPLLWLLPCPETQILLLDWARAYPVAGGLATLLSAMLESALAGDIVTAKKLAFAQQMVSTQAQNTGTDENEGATDDLLVTARNEFVIEEIEKAQRSGLKNIGVMYGALHMNDLQQRCKSRLKLEKVRTEWVTAWDVPIAARIKSDTGSSTATQMRQRATALGAVLLYIAVGAWDWSDTLVHVTKVLEEGMSTETALAVTSSTFLYVFRHVYLYYGLSKWLVQWDEKLFQSK